MLGRRRQSIQGGFGRAPSPSKTFPSFGRQSGSRDGRPIPSPRASTNNLREMSSHDNRLSSLAESPPTLSPASHINGFGREPSLISEVVPGRSPNTANGTSSKELPDLSDVQPPPGPPPSHLKAISEGQRDSEGFTVPPSVNDPISQAQLDAFDGDQPQFKLDIRKDPIPEQDADAQAALSNVANTLRSSQLATPNRKAGTIRGRRDVRNTIFVPPANAPELATPENHVPPSPSPAMGRAAALAALSSGDHGSTASDTTSIRSGYSLANHALVKHTDMHQPGLNASIIETFSATIENGEVKTTKVAGEIALTYNAVEGSLGAPEPLTIRINDFPNLEVIGPNRTIIHPVSEDKQDEFTLDLSHPLKSSIAFTYRVHIDESNLGSYAPLLIKPAWKPQGDKLALVVEYSLNPACSAGPVTFSNLVLIAMYEGAKASGCQTKPTGTHLKEKSLVYWRLGDVTLTNDWHKVIGRFIGAEGAVPEPGHIEARWEIQGTPGKRGGSGITLSRLEIKKGKEKEEDVDPFADEDVASPTGGSSGASWVEVECSRKLVSGKYEARQVEA